MSQEMYEVRVAGVVPTEDLQDMGAVALTPETVNTVLYGISDQAALYGLLERLRSLGIEVIEVRKVLNAPGGQDAGDTEGDDSADTDPGEVAHG